MNPGKLANGFRMISAGIPDPLPSGHEDNDVSIFWILNESRVESAGNAHIIGALRVVRVRGVGDYTSLNRPY